MATFKSVSLLMIVMACFFLKETSAEEREGKQILLSSAPAPFPFYYYANSPLYVNADVSKSNLEGRVSSKLLSPPDDYNNEAAGRTFFRIFGCPTCPTCPSPVVCPTCPTPVTPADGALFIPSTTGCATNANSLDATLTPCTRASAAPKGTIEVRFTAVTTSVILGIVGATPTTAIKVTCTSFPASFLGVTQFGSIAPAPGGTPTITGFGFVQFLASSGNDITANTLKCTWST